MGRLPTVNIHHLLDMIFTRGYSLLSSNRWYLLNTIGCMFYLWLIEDWLTAIVGAPIIGALITLMLNIALFFLGLLSVSFLVLLQAVFTVINTIFHKPTSENRSRFP
ncbi:hypothetical protein N479_24520 [Pseudoalteromonas luteoviolacea S4054]|uniref:Uncharacterized protein n=1 Tax=Pseudoalteromonas luteoviolacea S4054 TaxID=1129367 RepID=A0A0F6A3U9_9GAMM|nr:hypothetical protein N479_24520 [Pseudoalteromonas luteoviolacea S4054]